MGRKDPTHYCSRANGPPHISPGRRLGWSPPKPSRAERAPHHPLSRILKGFRLKAQGWIGQGEWGPIQPWVSAKKSLNPERCCASERRAAHFRKPDQPDRSDRSDPSPFTLPHFSLLNHASPSPPFPPAPTFAFSLDARL
ncbi:hypothetical protein SBV1_110033 [Verrucomicrobia bacterium]|nr:hypothetical protein SBV1_110033 [Verrucomicrobiota bacterium]